MDKLTAENTCTEQQFNEMFHVKHFQDKLEEFHVSLTEKQYRQLYIYYCNLVEWNKVMNLTGITDAEEVIARHFMDSCAIGLTAEKTPFNGKTLIDVGTGCGIPGIVLAVLYPDCRVTLMDSLQKRISFLNDCINKMELKNATAVHARAEDLGHDKAHREKYDYACARAVAAMPVLCEYCLPFLKNGGTFFAYKTEKAEEEVSQAENCLRELQSSVKQKIQYCVRTDDGNMELFLIRKERTISLKYPRKAGTPTKNPI